MNMFRYLIAIFLLGCLSSCMSFFIAPYGYVASDADGVLPDPKGVHIPLEAPSISQGYKPEINTGHQGNQKAIHEGIDIIADAGTPVLATATGKVIASYFEPFYGRHIVIAHGRNEDGRYIRSKYLHLQSRLVKAGDDVVRGQKIGTMGRSGLLSGGMSHLHFEIRASLNPDKYYYDATNPHKSWFDGVGQITCYDKNRDYPDTPFKTTYPVPCKNIDWQ